MCVCDYMCAHKHVYTFTCAYLIISQVSRNIYSVILLRSTQGSSLCSFPEMLHRFFPYGAVYLGALGMPVLLTLLLQLLVQNFTALSGHFGNFEKFAIHIHVLYSFSSSGEWGSLYPVCSYLVAPMYIL